MSLGDSKWHCYILFTFTQLLTCILCSKRWLLLFSRFGKFQKYNNDQIIFKLNTLGDQADILLSRTARCIIKFFVFNFKLFLFTNAKRCNCLCAGETQWTNYYYCYYCFLLYFHVYHDKVSYMLPTLKANYFICRFKVMGIQL